MLTLICLFLAKAGATGVTYGDLMIEEPAVELASNHELRLFGGYDVTNPYLNTYNYGLSYIYNLNSVVAFGLQGLSFASQASRYNQKLREELGVFGVTANDDRPQWAGYALVQLKALQGRVNLFGAKALPFRLNVRAGAGALALSGSGLKDSATWGFAPQIFLNSRWGVSLDFDQDLQSAFNNGSTVYRNRLALALTYVL